MGSQPNLIEREAVHKNLDRLHLAKFLGIITLVL